MKVLFVNRLFDGVAGGVERMSISMMNDLVRRGREVELLSWDQPDATTFYPLEPAVIWHRLGIGDATQKASLLQKIHRFLAMRRIVHVSRPDVIIAFQRGAFSSIAIASLGLGVPVIAAERSAPQRLDHLRAGKRRWTHFQGFRLARLVTVQMESYRSIYPAFLYDRLVAIPNPVSQPSRGANPAGGSGERRRLLCVARLTYQKNQGTLLDAFAKVAPAFPKWDLVLVGGGEDETKLRAQAQRLSLTGRVLFEGAVAGVERYYLDSHLFCLPSRWEGFPNALTEAMSYGLPAVGYADCAGVNELILSGETGLLADGVDRTRSLSDALATLMRDDRSRELMGRAGRAHIAAYDPDTIFQRWDDLFFGISRLS